MKDEYLKAYQQRIEEIKALDVSPEEKRKLAADAKNEILDQYKSSYIKEKEVAAQQEAQAATNSDEDKNLQAEAVQETEETPNEELTTEAESSDVKTAPVSDEKTVDTIETPATEADDIDNILNKLEEREERGEVGIELDTPTAFMNPDDLFSTMNLDDLFASLGIEDEDFEDEEIGDESELLADLDEMFMDSEALFAGLLDDVEDEVEADDILNEFDLNEDTKPLEPNAILNAETAEVFNSLNEDQADEQEVVIEQTEDDTQVVSSIETDVDEVEELTEGTIVDEDTDVAEELDPESVNELEELEKERERAQKLGAIEMALLVVLIVLVIIVVYLIIGV